ncbi:hypothetical protein F0562_007019 [Nyssa sinensis]|uniref:NPH3 domain-containing protein n=1 Tax=Nyssa sinensis TaxID=561372 RepID=A0A5J5A6Z6_9ASTE|nr:hypothetical protein F0562_007019 [Nyssa sinensis]
MVEKCSVSCSFLLKLLKAADILNASSSSKMELARKVGIQLEEATVNDINMATNLFQLKLAEVAANYMAPLCHRLRNCGELEPLDEELIDMVRDASVRLSHEGGLYM